MSNGKEIANLITQFKTLCRDIALLIRTADTLMAERGWELAANQCASLGTTPERADAWFPDDVFHFYKRPEPQYSNLLAFVSVVIASRDSRVKIDEPLVSGGIIEYEAGFEAVKSWQWWYAHLHCMSGKQVNDGSVSINEDATQLARWNPHFRRVRTFALPLVEITDAGRLHESVIGVLEGESRKVFA